MDRQEAHLQVLAVSGRALTHRAGSTDCRGRDVSRRGESVPYVRDALVLRGSM
jgi:hypothetical protein